MYLRVQKKEWHTACVSAPCINLWPKHSCIEIFDDPRVCPDFSPARPNDPLLMKDPIDSGLWPEIFWPDSGLIRPSAFHLWLEHSCMAIFDEKHDWIKMRSGEAYTIKGLGLLKVATYFYGLLALAEGFCPFLCECDDRNMKVICSADAHLDIIPITLNPSIKEIHLRHNKIR